MRPERQVVYPAAVGGGMCRSWDHGDASDREPPRSVGDDPGRATDELLGPPAGLWAPHWRIPDRGIRMVGPGADAFRHVPDRLHRRSARRLAVETHAITRCASALR